MSPLLLLLRVSDYFRLRHCVFFFYFSSSFVFSAMCFLDVFKNYVFGEATCNFIFLLLTYTSFIKKKLKPGTDNTHVCSTSGNTF
jgi:hypothetical protein